MQEDLKLRREFARKLRQAMDEKGLNQTEVAKQVGLSQSTVSDYLRQRSDPKQLAALPNTVRIIRFCRVLGVSSDWLLGLSSNPKGGTASAGQLFQEGGMRALLEMQIEIEALQARWHGVTSLDGALHLEAERTQRKRRQPKKTDRRGLR